MNYISTRDLNTSPKAFSDIILEGLAPDRGLYLPEKYPELSQKQLQAWATLPYAELAVEVLSLFVGDSISEAERKEICESVYNERVFKTSEITPIEKISGDIYVQDLSQGPSLAFKDMAMQLLAPLLNLCLAKRGERLNILGASSGDTVSAAEEALKGQAQINVFMLTPKTGMSPFQKAQAGSILDDNIFNISIEGPFDTCQDLVKAVNHDADFKAKWNIGAVNSINWGRIVAQVIYYIYGYLQTQKQTGVSEIDVVVPSGNFGNILAGYIAKQMGVPIVRLILASNENNVLHQFIQTGIYKQKDVNITNAPSMDISKASNLERLLFDLLGRDAATLKSTMETFESTGEVDLTAHLSTLKSLGFYSGDTNHQDRIDNIRWAYDEAKRMIDPHTASAVHVAREMGSEGRPMLCMETAKPCKFEDSIQEALDMPAPRPAGMEDLESREQRFFDVDANALSVQNFISEALSSRP